MGFPRGSPRSVQAGTACGGPGLGEGGELGDVAFDQVGEGSLQVRPDRLNGAELGALRAVDQAAGGAPLAPVPGVARLDELAARARSAGFAVSLIAHGPVRPLPAGVDAAAYRIVQEALTNAVRHSA